MQERRQHSETQPVPQTARNSRSERRRPGSIPAMSQQGLLYAQSAAGNAAVAAMVQRATERVPDAPGVPPGGTSRPSVGTLPEPSAPSAGPPPETTTSAAPSTPASMVDSGNSAAGPGSSSAAPGRTLGGAELAAAVGGAFDRMRADINTAYDRELAEGDRVTDEHITPMTGRSEALLDRIDTATTAGRERLSGSFDGARARTERSAAAARATITAGAATGRAGADVGRQAAEQRTATALGQATERLTTEAATARRGSDLAAAQGRVRAAAESVTARYAGSEEAGDVRSAVDEVAAETTSALGSETQKAAGDVEQVTPAVTERWRTDTTTARTHLDEAANTARSTIDQGLGQADQGITARAAEQSTMLDSGKASGLEQLASARSGQTAQVRDGVAQGTHQAREQNQAYRDRLEESRVATLAALDAERDQFHAQLAANPGAEVDEAAIGAELDSAVDANQQRLDAGFAGIRNKNETAWQGASRRFDAAAARHGETFAGGLDQNVARTTASVSRATGQAEHTISAAVDQTGARLTGVGRYATTAMNQVAGETETGLTQGLTRVTGSLRRGATEQSGALDNTVSGAHNQMSRAASQASASWLSRAASAIGSFASGLWSALGTVIRAIGSVLWWILGNTLNLLWGFIWGETLFPDLWGAGVFAFIGDLVAGVLIIGDIRDIVKYLIYWAIGKVPWWFALGMIVIAAIGIIPVYGDVIKAIVKGLFKKLLKEGLSAVAKEILERLGKELGERLIKEVGEETAEKLLRELGEDTLKKLSGELGGQAIKDLVEHLGADVVKKLAQELGGTAIKDVVEHLGADVVKKLAQELGGAAIKDLVEHLGADVVKKLAQDFGGAAIKDLVGQLGADVVKKLAADLTGREIQALVTNLGADVVKHLAADLTGKEIQALVKDLGAETLKNIGTHLTAAEIKDFVTELGAARVKELAEKYGGQAMKHYGTAFFKAYKGVDAATINHLLTVSVKAGIIKGCHDAAMFAAEIGARGKIISTTPHPTRPDVRLHEYNFWKKKHDGSFVLDSAGNKILKSGDPNLKTVIDDLASNVPEWVRLGNQACDDAIKRMTMPNSAAGGAFKGAAEGGLAFDGYIHSYLIDTIFVTF